MNLIHRIPTPLETPVPSRLIVEDYDSNGPFGAKGIGNNSVINMASAVGNAIYRAVGVRVKELPITPEKILEGLRGKERRDATT